MSVPAKRNGRAVEVDAGRVARRWWREHDIESAIDPMTLSELIIDVGKLSMAHLAKRLVSSKTPDKVRDQIALTMAPKMVHESRGRPKGPHGGPGARLPTGDDEAGSDILQTYRVSTK